MSEDQNLYVNRVRKSADRLNHLINDSLELVSAETGLTKVSPKKMALSKLINDVTSNFAFQASEKGMDFVSDINGAHVKADKGILTNVLQRLVENAIKFGDEKSKIEVSTKTENGLVLVEVKNQGKKSLDKKTIQKILKPFSLDENIMNHTKGTGLGLSVCQALLKTHKSHLQINSEKNHFKVSFDLPEAK